MTLSANVYTDLDNLQRMVGDLVQGRVFTDEGIPTVNDAENFIEDIAAEINALLEANGYTAPVVSATYPHTYRMLTLANTCGAASLVISMLPTEAWTDPEMDSPGMTRRKFYDARYKKVLDLIKDHKLYAARSSSDSFEAYAGSRTDRDTGETKAAIFTRKMQDYPGSRVLQE